MATSRIMHDSSRGRGEVQGKRQSERERERRACAWRLGSVRSCQRTHHICSSTLVPLPPPAPSLPLFTPPSLPSSQPLCPPPCLPFMRTKANKQQNICMLSQHMRRSLSRKASLLSVLSACSPASSASSSPSPLVRLKYFALLSRNYKSGQLLKICSRITKFASERSNERIADCARFLRLARRLQPWAEARTRLAAVVPSGSGLLTN